MSDDEQRSARARLYEAIDSESGHLRRIAEKEMVSISENLWARLGMRRDEYEALATAPPAQEARQVILSDSVARLERLMASFVRLHDTAWPIAKENARDRAPDKGGPDDPATVLIFRALYIAEELREEREAGRIAGRVYAEACKARVGTYSPAVLRALMLAAIQEEKAWGGTDATARGRHRHAIRQLAAAWRDCTGQEATASYDGTTGCELPNPFTEFAVYVLEDQGVTSRQIRRAIYGG